MASLFYNNYFEELGKGNIDFDGNTFKLMLVTTAYTPNRDSHAFRSDVTGEVAAAGGYAAGGNTVDNVTVTQDNTNDRAVVDFDNETFSNLSGANINAAVLYKSTGNAATDILVAYIEFTEGAQTVNDGSLTVTPSASGVLTIG
jgi:hypothetical protein